VRFAFFVEHVFEIKTVLDEFIRRKVCGAAPSLFKRIHEAHRIVRSLAGADPI
jgi:hypothetical protein